MIGTSPVRRKTPVKSDVALLILRLVAGGMLIYGHGAVKITHMIHGNFAFINPIGIGVVPSLILAAFAEAICSFFVAIGLFTRIAAFIVCIDLGVAFFSTFDQLALIYFVIFIALLLIGAGKYSFDYMR
jgi:putative oxidoreductase